MHLLDKIADFIRHHTNLLIVVQPFWFDNENMARFSWRFTRKSLNLEIFSLAFIFAFYFTILDYNLIDYFNLIKCKIMITYDYNPG